MNVLNSYKILTDKHVMKLCLMMYLTLSACAPRTQDAGTAGCKHAKPQFINQEVFCFMGRQAFIIWPDETHTASKWVWFAPVFLVDYQAPPAVGVNDWYFDRLREQGIAVVGVDVAESFGSFKGRAIFEEFYQHLQVLGFEEHGCMLLQSRGGLMGYNWIMDHPGRVKCVAGIYPLLTVMDYIGPVKMAPNWPIDPAWLLAHLNTQSPLERNESLPDVDILHLHGDQDDTVHLGYDQTFISQKVNANLIIIPGLGHVATPEFFQNQDILDFLLNHLQ